MLSRSYNIFKKSIGSIFRFPTFKIGDDNNLVDLLPIKMKYIDDKLIMLGKKEEDIHIFINQYNYLVNYRKNIEEFGELYIRLDKDKVLFVDHNFYQLVSNLVVFSGVPLLVGFLYNQVYVCLFFGMPWIIINIYILAFLLPDNNSRYCELRRNMLDMGNNVDLFYKYKE
jgi:hypothetical protein